MAEVKENMMDQLEHSSKIIPRCEALIGTKFKPDFVLDKEMALALVRTYGSDKEKEDTAFYTMEMKEYETLLIALDKDYVVQYTIVLPDEEVEVEVPDTLIDETLNKMQKDSDKMHKANRIYKVVMCVALVALGVWVTYKFSLTLLSWFL